MASHWIPEDDFILRKSIESGVSLESLAKGAVKFSRKFTISELTDRWHSLLYNPQVKSLSSSIGFELQYSAQFLSQSQDHDHHNTTQVRSQYYTARKRMRLEEPLNNAIDEHPNHLASGAVPAPEEEGNAFGDIAFDDFSDLEWFNESDIDNFHNSFLDFMQSTHQQDHDHDDGDDDRLVNQLLNINDEQIQDCNVSDTTTRTEHVLLQETFRDSLFQQPNTSFNQTTSHSHHQVVIPHQAQTWIAPQSYGYLPSKQEEYCHKAMSLSELDPHPEIKNGVLICSLNRESDEIPDNDDFNPQLHNPKARNSVIPSSSSSLRKHMRPPLPLIRGSSSQAKGNDMIQSYGFGDCAVTTQASCSTAFKDSFTEKATSSFTATTSTSLQHFLENEICGQTLSSEMDINAPMSEQEENNNEIESDEDLPSYSDVEAMILDMDLEPVGQDRYELEATRYRNEEMVRMIMRLEQSAESYMNRDIASHGAFALLYGSSKHYINKPEVLLGRATGEYPVDIDLGKSESGTRVSRQQALIKLKQDGSFEIKNLGKSSIWMNDKEIVHGEVVNLKNSCLIQIREMTFVFEMNKTCVKRYLDGIRR